MSNNYSGVIVKNTDGIEWEEPAKTKTPIVKDTSGIVWDEPSTAKQSTPWDNTMKSDIKASIPQSTSEDTSTTTPQKIAKEEDYKDYGRTSRAFNVAKKKSKYGMPTERDVEQAKEQLSAPSQLELDDQGKPTTGGLEMPWVSPEFAAAGLVRAGVGAVGKDALKVASGKGFTAGSIGGDVAAWTAHETVDKSLTDDFKQQHPVLSEAMKVSAALIGGVAGGMAAERRYMQQYQTLIDDVKEGVIPPQQAEEVLRQDTGVQDIINKVEITRAKYAEERAMQPDDTALRNLEQDKSQQVDEITTPNTEATQALKQAEDIPTAQQAEKHTLSPLMEKVNTKLQEMGHEPHFKIAEDIKQIKEVKPAEPMAENIVEEQPMFSKGEDITPEQRIVNRDKWHKDSVPETKNEDGTPKVFYHGTSADFSKFDTGKSYDGGLWFTSDINALNKGEVGAGSAGNIMPVFLKSKKMAGWDEYEKYSLAELKRDGYDGVKLDNDVIVFNPEQIKSIHNTGEYNPKSADILHSKGTQGTTTTEAIHQSAKKLLGKNYDNLKGDINIVQSYKDLPKSLVNNSVEFSSGGKVRGVFNPKDGKVHIVADTMSEKEAPSVIVHELLHKAKASGVKPLGEAHDTFVLRLKQLKDEAIVRQAMKAAKDAGTEAKYMNDEIMSYLVEKYQLGKDMSPKLKRFVSDVIDAVKVFASKTAVKLGVDAKWLISKMNEKDIAAILKSSAIKQNIKATSKGDALYSKTQDIINSMPDGFKKRKTKEALLDLKTMQKNYDDFKEWFRQSYHDIYRPIVKIQNELGIDEGSMITWDVAGKRLVEKGKTKFKMDEVNRRIEEIEKRIVEASKKLDAQPDEVRHLVDQYLISKHAPEYNKAAGEDLLGGAAGRSTQEARDIIKAIGSNREVYNAIRSISKDMQQMAKESLDVLLNAGVLNKEQYDKIKGKYKYYVPMHRIMPDDKDIRPLVGGGGASVKGTGIKKRVGSRELEVADIMSNIMFTTKSALERARKNTNAVRLSELLQQVKNPNSPMHNAEISKMFEIKSPKVIGTDSNGIPMMEHVADDGMTLFYRVDGKPKYIQFKDKALAQAALEDDYFIHVPLIAEVGRWMGAMYTRFNVGFAPRNFIRDTQEMTIFLSSLKDMGFKSAGHASSLAPKALKGVMDDMLGKDNEWSKLYRQMKEDGGTMGGFHTLAKKDIEVNVDDIYKEAQGIKANADGARRSIKKVLTAIDNYNQVFEDANRLAAYKASLDKGLSRERAAWIARNATIDFDRKGRSTRMASQFYIFFNPSVQGTAKLFRALKNPKTAAAVITGVGASVFSLNTYNDSVDKEWRKKVSPYDLKSSLCIVIPNKDKFAYAVVPLAWGVRPVYQTFNELYSIVNGEEKDMAERIGSVAKTFFDAYSPIQGNSLASLLSPTAIDPLIDIQSNEKSLGGMIRPDWMKEVPQSEQVFKEKGTDKARIDETLSGRVMHDITDITSEYTRIEYSPHDMDYALSAYFGGPYKLAKQGIDNLASTVTGDKVPPKGMPIVGDFYKAPEPEIIEQREKGKPYKELVNKLQKADKTERKILIAQALNKIEDADARKSILFKLSSGGYDTKGISPSNNQNFPQTKVVNSKVKQVTKEDIMLYHIRRGATLEEAKNLSSEWQAE